MKGLARTTGIVLIAVGSAVVLGGVLFLVRGVLRPEPFVAPLLGGSEVEGFLTPLRVLTGALLAIQGLLLMAAGEGLYLLASIPGRRVDDD